MSTFVIVNDVNTTLAASITSTQTTFSLSSSANLPTLAAGEIMPLTLRDAATRLIDEIVYVTSIAGSSVTCTRGQEGTAAQSWAAGDYAYSCVTAAAANSFVQQTSLDAQLSSRSVGYNGIIALVSASDTYQYVNTTSFDANGLLGTCFFVQTNTGQTPTTPTRAAIITALTSGKVVNQGGIEFSIILGQDINSSMFGATSTADSKLSLDAAVGATPTDGTLYINGAVYLATPWVINKQINIVCKSESDYINPVGLTGDAVTHVPSVLGGNGIQASHKINVFGGASAATGNAVVLQEIHRGNHEINVYCAAAYALELSGCLENNVDINSSSNYTPPLGSPAFQTDHVSITASGSIYTNANNLNVKLEGGGNGIVSADASSQGDNSIIGTIEGLSGKPFSFTGNKGLKIGQLHLESNTGNPELISCKNTYLGGPITNVSSSLTVTGARGIRFECYEGSFTVESTSTGVSYGKMYDNASTYSDASVDSEEDETFTNASSAVIRNSVAGTSPLENLCRNPYMDIWTNGTSSAPDDVTLTNATAAKSTSVYWGNNPSSCSAEISVTGTTINDGPFVTLPAGDGTRSVDRWVSFILPIYVATGQPDVRVYVLASGSYNQFADVTAKDTWVIVRGSVLASATNPVEITPRVYNGTAFVAGTFYIGGCSVVDGARAPKYLCDNGRRERYVVNSVSNTPAFVGQRAYLSGTGKWYLAAGTSSSTDWIILN